MILILLSFSYTPKSLPIRVNQMSTWLGYTLKNVDKVNELVPEGTVVTPMRILSQDLAQPKLLFNIYETESTFFNGLRFEVVTMVKQVNRPRNIHFVVLECLSNTLHWDPINGIQLPNLRCDFRSQDKCMSLFCKQNDRTLTMNARIGRKKAITKMFAVDANLICFFQNSDQGIKLSFNESQIMQDVNMLSHVNVDTNIWEDYRGKLTHCFAHPHHMDFTADMITLNEKKNSHYS